MTGKKLMGDIVYILHFLILFAIFYFAFFSKPQKSYLTIVIVAIILISWAVFDGDCPITKLEDHIRDSQRDYGFIAENVEKLTGKKISNQTATNICYIIFSVCMLVAIYRYHHWAISRK